MKRKFFPLLAAALAVLLTACGGQTPEAEDSPPVRETVELTVWGAEEDEALLKEIFASFQQRYAGEADFQISYQAQSESSCKDALLGGLEAGADVFAFVRCRGTRPHRERRGNSQRQPFRSGGGRQYGWQPLCLSPNR